MDSKNIEPEINFRDILFVVLKKVWIMVIVGIVLGGALFAYNILQKKYTSDIFDITKKLSSRESDVQYQIRVQNIERARSYASMIDNTNCQIEDERTYISEAIYMQIDPECIYQSTAQINLTLNNYDSDGIEYSLFSAYERDIRAGIYLNDYAESIGSKPDYIKELIGFSTSAPGSTVVSIDSGFDRVGSMYLSVVGPSEEFVNEVMNLMISEIQSVHDELNRTVCSHTIFLVGIQNIIKTDNSVRDYQFSHISKIQSLQGAISTYYQSLDVLAKELSVSDGKFLLQYVNTHPETTFDGVPTEVSEKEVSVSSMVKPNLKYIGIGFGAGAFLVALIIVLIYVFGKKFSNQAKFFGIFPSIKKIGVLKPLGKQSKYIRFINIKTEDDTKLSNDNNLKLISANYKNLTKDFSNVLITGTGDAKAMSEAVKSLKLKGDFRPDLFNNPEVLDDVTKYDGVVLLEQRNRSLIRTVKNEVSLISNGGTKIIGAIII